MKKQHPTLHDYQQAAMQLSSFLQSLPLYLRPIALYQNGHVKSPGISDLDFVIVVDDHFKNALELRSDINEFVQTIKFKETLFAHLPYIAPKSIAEKIAVFTYNPPSKFSHFFGNIIFEDTGITLNHVLQQLEFLSERLFMFAMKLIQKSSDEYHSLLLGHALLHSKDVLSHFTKIDMSHAQGIAIVEEYRASITARKEYHLPCSIEELNKLLFRDTCQLLQSTANILKSYIVGFIGNHISKITYTENVIWEDFQASSLNINLQVIDNKLIIKGLPDVIPMMYSQLFNLDTDSVAFFHEKLSKHLEVRQQIIKEFAAFNFLNYGASGSPTIACYGMGRPLLDNLKHLLKT